MAKKRHNKRTGQAKKPKPINPAEQKQDAQEVQEVTNSTPDKLPDPEDVSIEKATGIASAEYIIKKAAAYYGKPAAETTLQEAFDMIHEQSIADNPMTDKEKAELDEATENIINAMGEISDKEAGEITGADIQALYDGLPEFRLPDAALDNISSLIGATQSFREFAATVAETISGIFQSPEFKALANIAEQTASFMLEMASHSSELAEIANKTQEFTEEILPYIVLELADRTGEKDIQLLSYSEIRQFIDTSAEKPEKDLTPFEKELNSVLDNFAFDGTPETDYARELLAAAAKRKVALDENKEVIDAITSISESINTAPETEKAEIVKKELPRLKELPRIIAQQAEALDYPLDKPNSKIWNLLTVTEPNGQITLNFDTSKKGSGKPALIYYSIDFSALESLPELNITKQLTPFDKRVYIIAAALYNAGNEWITATQIYRADHDREPNDKDIKKINDSLTKMGAAHIYIDNKQEISINKKYPKFKYDASLLPFERVSAYINGQFTDAAIRLLREPPLITFARERKQITTIDRQVLLAPISKTDANLRIEDYLIERISHMKSPHSRAPRKLLYSTIFENCGITEKKQKQRAPEKIRRFLDYYIECELIKDYTETKEGIEIKL